MKKIDLGRQSKSKSLDITKLMNSAIHAVLASKPIDNYINGASPLSISSGDTSAYLNIAGSLIFSDTPNFSDTDNLVPNLGIYAIHPTDIINSLTNAYKDSAKVILEDSLDNSIVLDNTGKPIVGFLIDSPGYVAIRTTNNTNSLISIAQDGTTAVTLGTYTLSLESASTFNYTRTNTTGVPIAAAYDSGYLYSSGNYALTCIESPLTLDTSNLTNLTGLTIKSNTYNGIDAIVNNSNVSLSISPYYGYVENLSYATGLGTISSIATDSSNNVYAASSTGGGIQEFSNSGTLLGSYNTSGIAVNSIAKDSTGILWVTSSADFFTYNSFGGWTNIWARPDSSAYFSNIAIDSSNNGWVIYGNSVLKYNSSGALLGTYAVSGANNIAADKLGNIFITNSSSVIKLNPSGAVIGTYAVSGAYSIFIDQLNNVWVTDSVGGKIIELSNSGSILNTFTGIKSTTGISVDSNGNIWVVNSTDGLYGVSPAGSHLTTIAPSSLGTAPYELSTDLLGNIFIGTVSGNVTKVYAGSTVSASTVTWNSISVPNNAPNSTVSINGGNAGLISLTLPSTIASAAVTDRVKVYNTNTSVKFSFSSGSPTGIILLDAYGATTGNDDVVHLAAGTNPNTMLFTSNRGVSVDNIPLGSTQEISFAVSGMGNILIEFPSVIPSATSYDQISAYQKSDISYNGTLLSNIIYNSMQSGGNNYLTNNGGGTIIVSPPSSPPTTLLTDTISAVKLFALRYNGVYNDNLTITTNQAIHGGAAGLLTVNVNSLPTTLPKYDSIVVEYGNLVLKYHIDNGDNTYTPTSISGIYNLNYIYNNRTSLDVISSSFLKDIFLKNIIGLENKVKIISSEMSLPTSFTFNQSVASNTWNVKHNLNKFPAVTIVDSAGTQVYGTVIYIDSNNLVASFSVPFSGTLYCS